MRICGSGPTSFAPARVRKWLADDTAPCATYPPPLPPLGEAKAAVNVDGERLEIRMPLDITCGTSATSVGIEDFIKRCGVMHETAVSARFLIASLSR